MKKKRTAITTDLGEELKSELVEALVSKAEWEPRIEIAGPILGGTDREQRRKIAERLIKEKFPNLV